MCDVEGHKSSAKRTVAWRLCLLTLFHGVFCVLTFIVTLWGVKLWLDAIELKSNDTMIQNVEYYSACYLTNWNYLFQLVFFSLALAHNIFEWCDKHNTTIAAQVEYWRDVLFCSLVFPYTCFVFSMFWGLYAIDRELVFPKIFDEVIPWWFNQCVHSNIMIGLVVEVLLQARTEPRNRKLEITANIGVGVLYAIVYYTIHFLTNRWLYNVFSVMTWWQVCFYQIFVWFTAYIFHIIQFPISKLIHGTTRKSQGVIDGVDEGLNEKNSQIDDWNLKYNNLDENSKL